MAKVIISSKAAVASEHPLATLAGYDVLRNGGNAFDAAVATSLVLAVTLHNAGGIGGDYFGMFYEARRGEVLCLNSSGWSPSGLTGELVAAKGEASIPTYGPLSCVVPGYIAGIWSMHKRLGTLEFGELTKAALRYAQDGFPASDGLCKAVSRAIGELTPEARRIFAPNGAPPSPGDMIVQDRLALVIEAIAQGADAFYDGWPAARMQEVLEEGGIPVQGNDFKNFAPEWVTPISLDYRGMRVLEFPPNSMGATCLLILKQISELDYANFSPTSGRRIEATLGAAEVAYRRKDEMLGDPRFSRVDLGKFLNARAEPKRYKHKVREGDTTAFSIVDREGNVVSGIQSLYRHFGSRVFVPECGIVLNNRGSAFSMKGPNRIEPRKRPLHTLSSMMLQQDETPTYAIGSSGGDYRPLLHSLLVTNLVDYGMTLEQAIDHPRFLWKGGSDLLIEKGLHPPGKGRYRITKLRELGGTGVCQGVEIAPRMRRAVCDLRGDGIPAGF